MTEYRCGSGSTLHTAPERLSSPRHAVPPLCAPVSCCQHLFQTSGPCSHRFWCCCCYSSFTWLPCPPPPPLRSSLVVCQRPFRHAHVQPARSWLPSALGSPSSATSVAAASSTSSAPRTLSSTKRADSEGKGWRAGGYHSLLSPVHACRCNARSSWPLVPVEVRQRAGCRVLIDCRGGLARPQGYE